MGSSVPPMGQPVPYKDGEFVSQSQASVVTWKLKDVELPSPLYITRDDQLVVSATSLQGAETLTINARLLTVDGVVIPISRVLAMPTIGTQYSLTIPLAEGFLLSVCAISSLAVQPGQTFCRAWLNRGAATGANAVQMLISGYALTFPVLGWPSGTLTSPPQGPGWVRSLQVSNPGAGADFSFSYSTNIRVRVRGVCAILTTSGTAGNRIVQFRVQDSVAATLLLSAANANIVASTTATVVAQQMSNTSILVASTVYVPWPSDFLLPDGCTISSVTTGLLAGDQWSGIRILQELTLDGV